MRLQNQHHGFHLDVVVQKFAWNDAKSMIVDLISFEIYNSWPNDHDTVVMLDSDNDSPSKVKPAFLCALRNMRQRYLLSWKMLNENWQDQKHRGKGGGDQKSLATATPLICTYSTPSIVRMRRFEDYWFLNQTKASSVTTTVDIIKVLLCAGNRRAADQRVTESQLGAGE